MDIEHDIATQEPMSLNLVFETTTMELKELDTITQEIMFMKTFVERVFQTETIETWEVGVQSEVETVETQEVAVQTEAETAETQEVAIQTEDEEETYHILYVQTQ